MSSPFDIALWNVKDQVRILKNSAGERLGSLRERLSGFEVTGWMR